MLKNLIPEKGGGTEMILDENDKILSERPVKMLIVERNMDYLEAAEFYFERFAKKSAPFSLDYAMGIKGAKKKIRSCFEDKEPYDYVFTSLELDEKTGGFEVIREALMHGTLGFLISDIAYKDPISPHLKPNTKIDVLKKSYTIKDRRDSSRAWEGITLCATTFYVHDKGKNLIERINDEEGFPINQDSYIVKQILKQYVESAMTTSRIGWDLSGYEN